MTDTLKEAQYKTFVLSFRDTQKPKGDQFLGVIITRAIDINDAILKTKILGTNPGGEIQCYEIEDMENCDCQDKLLNVEQLRKYGFCK